MSQSVIKNSHLRYLNTDNTRWVRFGVTNYGNTMTLYANPDGNGNGIIIASKSLWAMSYRAPDKNIILNKLQGNDDTSITLTATINVDGVITITSSYACSMMALYITNDYASN